MFRIGEELPGDRFAWFVVSLLRAADLDPERSIEAVVAEALSSIEDGPLSLVAVEPGLAQRELRSPVTSPAEAASGAVTDFAEGLLQRHRNGDFKDLWGVPEYRIG